MSDAIPFGEARRRTHNVNAFLAIHPWSLSVLIISSLTANQSALALTNCGQDVMVLSAASGIHRILERDPAEARIMR